MSPTYEDWPPPEQELLDNKTVIPATLTKLLTSILTTGKGLSTRKQRLVNSIGQDIVHNTSGGTYKTSKHETKNWFKRFAKMDEKFGHGISFKEDHLSRCKINFPDILHKKGSIQLIWFQLTFHQRSKMKKVSQG